MFYCQECGPDLRITKVRKVGEKEMPSQMDVALWCYKWPLLDWSWKDRTVGPPGGVRTVR